MEYTFCVVQRSQQNVKLSVKKWDLTDFGLVPRHIMHSFGCSHYSQLQTYLRTPLVPGPSSKLQEHQQTPPGSPERAGGRRRLT